MTSYRHTPAQPIFFTLVLLCLLAFVPGEALGFFQFQQSDQNGRTRDDQVRQGAPVNVNTPTATDVWKGCDQDVCPPGGTETRVSQSDLSLNPGLTGSKVSVKIQQGAPENSFYVAQDGNIGLGTENPLGRFHIVDKPGTSNARDLFLLDANGNLKIGGLLTESSSKLLKEGFWPVSSEDILSRLASLPITTWHYKTEAASVRHMGPVAQDFYAAFGLGSDEEHIAPLDANGVALAAIQALHTQNQSQAERIATLEEQNALLLQRLQALEALVQQGVKQP